VIHVPGSSNILVRGDGERQVGGRERKRRRGRGRFAGGSRQEGRGRVLE